MLEKGRFQIWDGSKKRNAGGSCRAQEVTGPMGKSQGERVEKNNSRKVSRLKGIPPLCICLGIPGSPDSGTA
jgi:hypothetical protein